MIERAVIRNEANVLIEDLQGEAVRPPPGDGAGRKLDPALQQAWRAFAERFLASHAFDDSAQPLPRIGGLGWIT